MRENDKMKKQTTSKNISSKNARSAVNGSNAYKLNPNQKANKRVGERIDREQRSKQKAAIRKLHLPSALLVMTTVVLLSVNIFQYIELRSDTAKISTAINGTNKEVISLIQLNDEKYDRILSNINLDTVREVAINELGMVYASDEQIIDFDAQVDDYVQQYIGVE